RRRTADLERRLILEAYSLHAGNQVHMARALGISRGSLQYKLAKYGLQ
ncbi:MAG TPA: helix-turn-helix domain-containing protein, partial [Leptospiraceae bacterium]|nr:helix-turn-helix domain-containing protein [Leptospiraceae bacterium]